MTDCAPNPWDKLTWCQEQRIRMMENMIRAYGYINRKNIEQMFRISTPQASAELALFDKLFPGLLTYNKRTKRYEQTVPWL